MEYANKNNNLCLLKAVFDILHRFDLDCDDKNKKHAEWNCNSYYRRFEFRSDLYKMSIFLAETETDLPFQLYYYCKSFHLKRMIDPHLKVELTPTPEELTQKLMILTEKLEKNTSAFVADKKISFHEKLFEYETICAARHTLDFIGILGYLIFFKSCLYFSYNDNHLFTCIYIIFIRIQKKKNKNKFISIFRITQIFCKLLYI